MKIHKKHLFKSCCLGIVGLFLLPQVSMKLMASENNNIAIELQALKKKIQGKVKDSMGEMVGVTVVVVGTTHGTITNYDGSFELDVAVGQTIKISFIGYKTQMIKIADQSLLNITLEQDTKMLGEVMVVGYGSQKKSDITGAMVNVKADAITQTPSPNVANALQGLAAGVDVQMSGGNNFPGAVSQIRIRGERSINAGNDALIVVDGIPFSGSLNDISPDDVEAISILKDASATAIYGARGANGVILITTKRGQSGKVNISYSGYYGIVTAVKDFKIMGSDDFLTMKKWAYYNANPSKYSGIDDDQLMGIGGNGIFSDQDEKNGYLAGNNTDWQDLIFRNGATTNHQVLLTGGNEKTTYAASVGYFKGENNYEAHSFERINSKISIDSKVNKWLSFGLSSMNTYTKRLGEGSNPMEFALRASPFITPYKEDGTLWGALPGSKEQVWNPLLDLQNGALHDNRKNISTFTSGYAEVALPYGIKYKLNGGFYLKYSDENRFQGSHTTARKDGYNWAFNRSDFSKDYTLENLITWDYTLLKDHKINLTGLFGYQDKQGYNSNINSYDYYDENILSYNPGASDIAKLSAGGGFEKWSMLSYMARMNYNFKDRYLLTATIRHDGSSRLAPGNKWHSFPSLALGWNITNESFMKQVTPISSLKLRASWGNVGSTAIGPYQTLSRLNTSKYMLGMAGQSGVRPKSVPDTSLGWENTETINLGLDFGVLNNRISGTIEWYRQKTTDLLVSVSLPATSGYSDGYLTNLGGTQNKGLEFNVTTHNLIGDGKNKLSWSTDFNIFKNRSKITDLGNGVTRDVGNNYFVGQDRWVIYSLEADGLWQNTPEDKLLADSYGYDINDVVGTIKVKNHHIDYEDDGVTPKDRQKINDDDKIFLGKRTPNFEGGLNNRLAFKGFDLSFLFTFRSGGLITSDMHNGWMNTLQGLYNNMNVDYWTPDNTGARWPKPTTKEISNKGLLARYDASYLKLKNITLGYNIPQNILDRVGIKSARIYTTASNLWIYFDSQYKKDGGVDPETTSTISLGTPATRSFVFGLNLSF